MVLNESVVSKCLYNPLSGNLKEEMLPKLPMIKEYKGGRGKIPIDSILKYLVLMYDVQSPLHREVKDYYGRKKESALYAEFPTKDGRWRDDAQSILIGTDKWFNGLLAQYLSLQATPEYMQLVIYLELLARKTRGILDGDIDDKTHVIVKSLTESIRELTDKVFGTAGEDEVQAARQALYAKAEEDRVRMRPEDIIGLLNEEGILPSAWGYGEGYEVEQITFIGDAKPMTDEL
jgi:hypothetical protein